MPMDMDDALKANDFSLKEKNVPKHSMAINLT